MNTGLYSKKQLDEHLEAAQKMISGLEELVQNLQSELETLEGNLEVIESGNYTKSVQNHAKLILRQSRMERFISNEEPSLYKRIQEHLKTFEEK